MPPDLEWVSANFITNKRMTTGTTNQQETDK